MNQKINEINNLLSRLVEGKTLVINKLNSVVGSNLTIKSSWKEIEKVIIELSTGKGYAQSPNAYGYKIVFLLNYIVTENEYGETLKIVQ